MVTRTPVSKLVARMFASALLLSSVACVPVTRFVGSEKVIGGADACRTRCEAQGLEFAGMVMMGDYTDGCLCRTSDTPEDEALELGAASASGAAAAAQWQVQQEEDDEEKALRYGDTEE